MSADSAYEFDWPVPESGYQWCDALSKQEEVLGRWLVPTYSLETRSPWPGRAPRYQALEHRGLFRTFAEMQATEEGILAFTKQYGWLGVEERVFLDGQKRPDESIRGERFERWVRELKDMQETLTIWDDIQAGHVDAYRHWQIVRGENRDGYTGQVREKSRVIFQQHGRHMDFDPSMTYKQTASAPLFKVQETINEHLETSTVNRLIYAPQDDRLLLRIIPKSLLGALWLQLAKGIEGDIEYRQCHECGKWFEISLEAYRKSRLFCSNACRSKAYRTRQASAQRLYAGGMPIEQIAESLDTDPQTAKRWATLATARPKTSKE